MTEHTAGPPTRALSFGSVADAYARARPSYPTEAAVWLTGRTSARILELGAGTGKLTAQLCALGHRVTATDPSRPMLRHLAAVLPVPVAQATAERIPLPARSVDVVVSAQAFHWFAPEQALPEIARVLRPDGMIGLVWNVRDERVPWVRRLGRLIGTQEHQLDPVPAIDASQLFEPVETTSFRFWEPLTRRSLRDLVTSRSNVAVMDADDRERLLADVDDLYRDCARGAEDLLLPYVTRCYRARVREPEEPDTPPADDPGPDSVLIDFR